MMRISGLLSALMLAFFVINPLQSLPLDPFQPRLTRGSANSFLLERVSENDIVPNLGETVNDSLDFAFRSWHRFVGGVEDFAFRVEHHHSTLYYAEKVRNLAAEVNLTAGIDHHFSDRNHGFQYWGMRSWLNVENRMIGYADWWGGRVSGDTQYATEHNDLLKGWLLPGHDNDNISYDHFSGKLAWLSGYGNLSVGRSAPQVGSSVSSGVILSATSDEYAHITLDIPVGQLRFTMMQAALVPDSTDSDAYMEDKEKYLALHAIYWDPNPRLTLFIGESVVYGNRSVDFNYLLPQAYYRIIKHRQADRDNALIFAGFEWEFHHDWLWYGNVILDEMRKARVLDNWWGNKYALQTGVAHTGLFGPGSRATVEFTAIRPWIYTHYQSVCSYGHADLPLGFDKGANLIQVAGELLLPLRKRLDMTGYAAFTRQGSVGNNYAINYLIVGDMDDAEAYWLEGTIENTLEAEVSLNWQPLASHRVKVGIGMEKTGEEDPIGSLDFSWQAMY